MARRILFQQALTIRSNGLLEKLEQLFVRRRHGTWKSCSNFYNNATNVFTLLFI